MGSQLIGILKHKIVKNIGKDTVKDPEDENKNKPDYIEEGHKYYTERYKLLFEELYKDKDNNEIFRFKKYSDKLEPEEIDDICENITYTSHQLVKPF